MGVSVKSSVSSSQEGDYVMSAAYGLTAIPAFGVATSGVMHMGVNYLNRAAPGSGARSGTWWVARSGKADPAASIATMAAVLFQVGSTVCNANR